MQHGRGIAARSALVVALWHGHTSAQALDDATRAAARDIGYAAVEAFQAGQYGVASEKFEKAYRIVRTPSLGLWSARALAKLGKYVEASERYQEVTLLEASGSGAAVQKQAQADAANELAQLKPKIPSLVVQLEGVTANDAKITIDGAPLSPELIGEPRPVNPGRHQIALERGGERATWDVMTADGERKSAVMGFTRRSSAVAPASDATRPGETSPPVPAADADATPKDVMRTVAWVTAGVGGAVLLTGGVTTLVALGKKSDLDSSSSCREANRCLPDETSRVDGYNSLRMVSIVTLVTGTVLATTGVVLLLTAPKPNAPTLTVWMSPNAIGMGAKF